MRIALRCCCVALVMLLASTAFAQWQYAYNRQYGVEFQSVHFPTSAVGYVVGGGGAIFKTTDGGSNWALQTSPVTTTLNRVYFTDANTGWAVGAGGTILETVDGGVNWVVNGNSGVITTQTLRAVQFIGNKGWIGGIAGTLFYTNDGGVNWTAPTTNPYTDDVNDIAFVSTSVGYAAVDGDGIMYTVDGGVNWTAASVSFGTYPYTRTDIEVIMAVNDTVAVASGWGSLVGLQPTIILTTSDAGKTWTSPDPVIYHWSTYGYGWGLGMFGDGEIVLTGGGSGSAGFVLHSTDKGQSWTSSPAIAGEDIRDCCAVPGTNRMVACGDEGILALSTDKGRTWSFVFNPGTGFNGWHGFASTASDEILVCGAQGHLLRLKQDAMGVPTGAYEFSVVAPQNFAPSILHDIWYVGDVLYVCGSNRYLCKSLDRGRTWTQLSHAPSATDGMYKMWWFDANNGLIVGEIGSQEVIWRTTDGGANLSIIWADSTGTSLQWNSISFAPENPLVGVICGDDNAIVHTTNGGLTWAWSTENIATTSVDCEEVHMVSATTGYMVCDAGNYLKTTNGGAAWTVQPSITTKGLMDVDFRYPDQPLYGWIAGDDQTFFYTTDGGTSWTAANPTLVVPGDDVNSVYFQSPAGLVWIGADYGQVQYRFDTVTAIEDPISLPYSLGQNYPNPFNPTTTIQFSLPALDRVTLNVYDVSGRLVATVLDRTMEAGPHVVRFDASGLASGVYFYRLETNAGVETKKMVLLQ